jgi:hypothetical protein
MQEWIASPWLQDFASNLLVSLVVFAVGFVIGKWRGRRQARGRNLEPARFRAGHTPPARQDGRDRGDPADRDR